MLSQLLVLYFTAVFSESVRRTLHEGLPEFQYSPVRNIQAQAIGESKPLPDQLNLQFEYQTNLFNLSLTAKRDRSYQTEDGSYYYYRGEGHLFDISSGDHVLVDRIDFARFQFVNLDIQKQFDGSVSFDGTLFSFQPSHRQAHVESPPSKVIGFDTRHSKSRRQLNTMDLFDDCWPQQSTMVKEVEIGYIVDPEFAATAIASRQETGLTNKQKIIAAVTKINDESNAIYRPQLGVELKMDGESIIDQGGYFDEQMTNSFPLGCAANPSISNYLETLAAWRTSVKPREKGLWKLLTDCFPPPGTIGIAYLGTLCREYGVGITTWTDDRTWLTNAHEAGHIFGAGHSFEEGQGNTGGIMDYGDGLLNGVYQFNEQYRKLEVCGVIANTMANSRVPNCWRTLSVDGNTRYDWVKKTDASGGPTLGACLPEIGNYVYRTTEYECHATNAQGAVTVVDSANCPLSDKPIVDNAAHQLEGCAAQGLAQVSCGNGVIEPGEACEPGVNGAGACCAACQWVDSDECAPRSTKVDAAAVVGNILYVFQNEWVYRYSPGGGQTALDRENADQGYPRLIANAFPGLQTNSQFLTGVTAALARPGSSLMYLFKALDYVVYDISTNAVTASGDASTFLSRTPTQCGSVDAAIGFKEEMYLFCESVFNIAPYGGTWSHFRPNHDLELGWPNSVKSHLQAVAHNEVTGETVFWNGGYKMKWSGMTVVQSAQAYPGLGERIESGGDENAANCPNNCAGCDQEDTSSCTSCSAGYVLRDTSCVADNIFAQLYFNYPSTSDASYVRGGSDTLQRLFSEGKYTQGIQTVSSGDDELGLAFDGSDKLEMEPINREWRQRLAISAYFKPTAQQLQQQTFVTMTDGREEKLKIQFGLMSQCEPPSGCSCKEVTLTSNSEQRTIPATCGFYGDETTQPYCYVDGDCAGRQQSSLVGENYVTCDSLTCSEYGQAGRAQFELEVTIGDNEFTCFVSDPLTIGSWNSLEFVFDQNSFTTGVNGMTHTRAYDEVLTGGTTASSRFAIRDWWFGDDSNGIYGVLDQVTVTIGEVGDALLSGGGSGSGEGSTANGGAIAAGILVPLFIIGLCVLAYFYKDQIALWIDDVQAAKAKPVMTVQASYPQAPAPKTTAPGSTQKRFQNRPSFNISRKGVEWHYASASGETIGPIQEQVFKAKLGKEITKETYVWNDSMTDWKVAGDVPALQGSFASAPPKRAPPPFKKRETAEWHYVDASNESRGPETKSKLLSLYRTGKIKDDTLVWNGSTVNDWTAYSKVPTLKRGW